MNQIRSPLTARLVLTDLLAKAAWDKRGRGFSNTVNETGWRDFETLMREAREAFSNVGNDAVHDPKYHLLSIEFAGNLGDGDVRALGF